MSYQLTKAFDVAMEALEQLKNELSRECGLKVAQKVQPIYVSLDSLRDKLAGNIS